MERKVKLKITNDLLNNSHIIFESNIKNQIEALTKITDLAFSLGYITNRDELLKAFLAREQESSTGFEGGIAIPHARIKSIKKPAILILCNNNGIDWKAIDGQLTTFIIALIIPETQAENLHLDILSTLAIKLVNEDFRKKLKNATNSQEIISLINDETVKNCTKKEIKTMKNKETKKIVGVSSCTTGLVHTYMCKELLETAGKELGYQVHIECQGQKGPEYVLTEQEIKEADVVILATDVAIDLERFIGKKTYTCGTKPVVKDAKQTIKESLTKAKIYGETNGNSGDFILNASKGKPAILKHLLSGVSYMIPFVVFAGLIFAIVGGIAKGTFGNGFEFKNSWEEQLAWLKTNPPGVNSGLIGGTTLMHVLMIITFLLVSPGTGMWFGWGVFNLTASSKIDASQPFQGNANVSWTLFGALYGGLMAGYLVRFVNSWKVPKWLLPIMPIIIIPVFCTAIIAIPTAFFLAAPFGYVMGALDYGLSWMGLHPNIGF